MVSHFSFLMALLAAVIPALENGEAEPRSASQSVHFSVRIENVSTMKTLKLSDGTTAPAPTAPVLWLVHTNESPIFKVGKPDRGQGLEALAEDGNPSRLAEALKGRPEIVAVGFVNTPVGASEPGPILPGLAYEFGFTASPGQRLTIAMMFGQSNDLFYAPDGAGIMLFDKGGKPVRGDITSSLILWDAGTEVNQEPGLGADQAPRQMADNTGAEESRPVDRVNDRFTYPSVKDVVRVTVTPHPMSATGSRD